MHDTPASVGAPAAVRQNPDVSVSQDVDPEVVVPAAAPDRRPVVAGAAAGLWSLLVGVALVSSVVMLAWALSPNSAGDSAAAWRAAGTTWLGAHLVPLQVGGQPVTLLPLGALLLGLLLNRRGGRWAGRLLPSPTATEAAGIVASCAVVYGVGGAGVAWLSASPSTRANPGQALLITATVAAVGAAWGISREADLVGLLRARLSDAAWRTMIGGLIVVAGLFAAGGVLVTFSLLRSIWHIATSLAGLEAGVVGALAITLLAALCLPTLNIWGMSLIVGPGFALGSDGGLSVLGGEVQTLPTLPVLAAIPATVPGWAPALLLVPVALGAFAGRIRWGRDLPTSTGVLVSGAGLAGVVAVLVAGLATLASGSLGGGRLAQVGPAVLPTAAAAAVMVLLGFLAEAGFQSARLSWDLYRAESRAGLSSAGSGPRAAGRAPVDEVVVEAGDVARDVGEAGAVGEAVGVGDDTTDLSVDEAELAAIRSARGASESG